MSKYKIKKGLLSYEKELIEDWITDQMCNYFKNKFFKAYGVKTRRPIGQIKLHINKRTISLLFRTEGRSIDIHPNELFRDYIDWIIKKKNIHNFRIWYFSKLEMMVDFLDVRAKQLVGKELGSSEDFEKQEAQYLKEAVKYFEKREKEVAEKYKDEDDY